MRDDWTSYGIQWCRADTRPRPDFDLSPQSMLYRTSAGDPLFTVVSHGGVPSEGIFTLIAEAPRTRDEVDAEQRKENVYMEQLEATARDLLKLAEDHHDYILKITGSVDGWAVIERAREALGDA